MEINMELKVNCAYELNQEILADLEEQRAKEQPNATLQEYIEYKTALMIKRLFQKETFCTKIEINN